MQKYTVWALVLALGALQGCSQPGQQGTVLRGAVPRARSAVQAPVCEPPQLLAKIDPKVLPDSIWSAEAKGDCPRIPPSDRGSWFERRLYPLAGPQRENPNIRTLCQYTWKPRADARPDLEALGREGLEPRPDAPTLGLLATNEATTYYQPLEQLALARFDVPQQLPAVPTGTPIVQVAIIDTAETREGFGVVDDDGHGIEMGKIVELIACRNQTPCKTHIHYYPALSFLTKDGNLSGPAPGLGYLGTRTELAAQIRQATDDWLNQPIAGARPPLLINLSLGWSGCYGDPEGSRRVRDALAYASCQGALVFAAGGNGDVIEGCPTTPQPTPEDPAAALHMFPGLWGGTALTDQLCREAGAPGKLADVPLLLGIGAVDYRDYQLSFTDHEADLAAYGQAVAVRRESPLGWTAIGGTSVSTAAITGMAATLLQYAPQLSSREVVDALYKGAVDLPRSAAAPVPNHNICNRSFLTTCDPARVSRVSLCQLLRPHISIACDPLQGGVLTPTPGLLPLFPDPYEPPLPSPLACTTCPGPSCPAGCMFPADAGERDGRDKAWVQGQRGKSPAGCTCRGPADSAIPHGSWVAYAIANTPKVSFEVRFEVAVSELKLHVKTNLGEQRFVLGSAAAHQLRRWNLDVPGAQTAKVTYQLPDNTLEVNDVRLWIDVQEPPP